MLRQELRKLDKMELSTMTFLNTNFYRDSCMSQGCAEWPQWLFILINQHNCHAFSWINFILICRVLISTCQRAICFQVKLCFFLLIYYCHRCFNSLISSYDVSMGWCYKGHFQRETSHEFYNFNKMMRFLTGSAMR